MRKLPLLVVTTLFSFSLLAQPAPRTRVVPQLPRSLQAGAAEAAVKQAMDQLAADKKAYERDLDVLRHLRAADVALTDPMQPNNAVQKAHEEVGAAKILNPEFTVMQGVIRAEKEIENARLSPMTTDFGRLRGIIRTEAIGPASRVVARNGARLQDDTLSWIRVQELISSHLRQLAEISAESLRAASQ